MAWERQHSIVAESVRLNELGLSRVDAQRLSEGEPSVSAAIVATTGSEVTGRTQAEREAAGEPALTAPQTTVLELPTSVDNSQLPFFPPIRNQGNLGSCVQFANIYYMMTHMTAMARGWDVKNDPDNTHKFSPKWTYNFVNGGDGGGTSMNGGLEIALSQGVATWADCPYDTNYTEWIYNDPAVWRRAMDYRMDQAGVVTECDTETGLDALKTLLVDGYVVTFLTGNPTKTWQFKPISDDPGTTADDPYVGKDVCCWTNDSTGHAMTIVGYNDNIWADINGNGTIDAGEKGALRIANSWGTSFKDHGFTWLAYDAIKLVSAVPGAPSDGRVPALYKKQVHWVTARSSYEPSAVAEFTIQHAERDQVKMGFAWGDSPTVPRETWTPTLLMNQGGPLGFDGLPYSENPSAAPDGTFMFDCSDFVTRGVEQYYMLALNDTSDATLGGTIKSFQMLDGDGNVWATCPTGDSPGEVPRTDWDRVSSVAVVSVSSPLAGLVIDRAEVPVAEGASASFGVWLASAPVQPVTVNVAFASGDATIAVALGQTLTFTSGNWNACQTVVLSAAEDADALNGSATITCSAAGVDTVSLSALARDNDHAVYYVNDNSTANDQWCTAPGNSANDGHSPDHPKRGVQGIIDAYQLLPGDTVRIDTGTYSPSGNILVGPDDSGDALAPVVFEASPYGVRFQRGDTTSATAYCWEITGNNITLTTARGTAHPTMPEQFMKFTGGYYGARVAGNYCTVERVETSANSQSGIYVDDAQINHVTLRNCLIHGSTASDAREIRIHDADQVRVENCTVVAGGQYAISCYQSDDAQLINNVVVASGNGNACVFVKTSPLFSDFSDLFATSGAAVGEFSDGTKMATMVDWRAGTNVDGNSLSADPLFVNAAAGDYHEQSAAGSYHDGLWTADGASSPAIDAGNRASPFANEPAFNGGRVNLGVYGNTEQASRSNISLDTDGNGRADALTDGILILRYLFDPTGQWNYSDALGSGATRTNRAAIKSFLDGGRTTVLDVDGNGTPDALTDGILILRYLFDPSGAWNYSDALGSGATRTTREAIKSNLDQYNPAVATLAGLNATAMAEAQVAQLAASSTHDEPSPTPRASESSLIAVATSRSDWNGLTRKETPAAPLPPAQTERYESLDSVLRQWTDTAICDIRVSQLAAWMDPSTSADDMGIADEPFGRRELGMPASTCWSTSLWRRSRW